MSDSTEEMGKGLHSMISYSLSISMDSYRLHAAS